MEFILLLEHQSLLKQKLSLCNTISNKAAIVQPSLSQVITEGLIDAFLEQTNLEITENEGDLSFSGYITEISDKTNGNKGK